MRLCGFDVARYGDDKCSAYVIQQMGALHWEEVFVDEWDHRDLNYTTGRILAIHNEQRAEKSVIDENGIGAAPLDTLNYGRDLDAFVGFRNDPYGIENDKEYGNVRTKNVYKLKELVRNHHIVIKDPDTIKELTTLRYRYDHYQRKILISKDIMRTKYQVKSPNRADALIMVASLIGEVKMRQDRQYYSRPTYSQEENLYNIAGIR
jgi:hypothetical protein